MELLHAPPPGFDAVANAFAMAQLPPTTDRRLFSHPADAAQDDDPSCIRRAPVELRPAGSGHANS